jgi:hypothetical protein
MADALTLVATYSSQGRARSPKRCSARPLTSGRAGWCGCSSTVEPQPSKLVIGVRFPSSALAAGGAQETTRIHSAPHWFRTWPTSLLAALYPHPPGARLSLCPLQALRGTSAGATMTTPGGASTLYVTGS